MEITEILLSNLERTNRLDSEFYSKINLRILEKLKLGKYQALTDCVNVSDGNHMSISNYFTDGGIPYYRGSDIYNFFIEQTLNPLYIPEEIYNWNNLKRSHLSKGDVLISIVGAIIGNLSLVKTDNKATCSCKLAILRPTTIEPEVCAIFLKSKYGQSQIQKFRRGSGQTGFILEDFNQLIIPEFTNKFRNIIKNLVDRAYIDLDKSKSCYKDADALLIKFAGLDCYTVDKSKFDIRSFSESFGTSGRLDAEYYQPKFEKLLKKLKEKDFKKLGDLADIYKSIEPGSDAYQNEGIPFLRVSNLTKFGLSDPEIFLEESSFSEVKMPKKNTMLLSKDGSVGIAYKVPEDLHIITSGAILHLNLKSNVVLPDYLTLVLNSFIVQMQAERDAGGSIIQHWKPSEIENVLIPIIGIDEQKQISRYIQDSFKLKKSSEQLLDIAKVAIELAVESNETIAMEYIKKSLD